jgi:hypothetical protein
MMTFDEWVELRARHRARFWRTQGWTNLKRGTIARWTMMRRHWPESYLPEFTADLSDHQYTATPAATRPRARVRKSK